MQLTVRLTIKYNKYQHFYLGPYPTVSTGWLFWFLTKPFTLVIRYEPEKKPRKETQKRKD
jgi:hypothetical protein